MATRDGFTEQAIDVDFDFKPVSAICSGVFR